MFSRSPIFFPLVLAVLLALVTFWINLTVEEQGPKIDGSNRHDPDYTMNNFVTTQTEPSGKLSYVLAATEMVHYPDDDSTVLQRPRFTQFTVNKPYTQIEALRGYVSSNGEEIELVDNVKVVRQAFEGKGEMQVLTEKLIILPNQNIAKTDSAVLIKQAPKTVIRAKGMVFDKKNQTIKLFNRVKVHYERPAAMPVKSSKKTINKTKLTSSKTLTTSKKLTNRNIAPASKVRPTSKKVRNIKWKN